MPPIVSFYSSCGHLGSLAATADAERELFESLRWILFNVCMLVARLQGCLRMKVLVGQIVGAHVNQLTNKVGRISEKNCLAKIEGSDDFPHFSFALSCFSCVVFLYMPTIILPLRIIHLQHSSITFGSYINRDLKSLPNLLQSHQ